MAMHKLENLSYFDKGTRISVLTKEDDVYIDAEFIEVDEQTYYVDRASGMEHMEYILSIRLNNKDVRHIREDNIKGVSLEF